MPLRQRLIVLIALVLLGSIAAGALLKYWQAQRRIDAEMSAAIEEGKAEVENIISLISDGADVRAQLGKSVAAFDGERQFTVSLIDASGTVVQKSRMEGPDHPAPEWLLVLFRRDARVSILTLPERLKVPGTIRIETSSQNEASEVWDDIKLKIGLFTAFFGFVMAIVYWTLGRALYPLEKLAQAFDAIGKGNLLAQVPEEGPVEFKSVYQQFNIMAAKLAEAERKNRSLNEQLSTVQEEERADIARDLHDEVGPFLFAADVDAQTIPSYIERGATDEAINRAGAIRQSVAHIQAHLRSILSRLRPAVLLDLGLSHAIEQLTKFWQLRRPDIAFDVSVTQTSFGAAIDEVAYRVVQEGISNAIRHGSPKRIEVRVQSAVAPDRVRIDLSDDGAGLRAGAPPGFGLAGMRERVWAAGGSLTIENKTGGPGVILVAELPLREPAVKRAITTSEGVLIQ